MFKILFLLSLLLITKIVIAEDNYKICLTGRIVKILPSYGESFINGANLSIDENGMSNKIELKTYLFENKPLEAISVYNKMLNDHCSAIIGYEYLSDLLLVSNTQKNELIPIISNYPSKNKSDIYPKNILLLMPDYDFLAEKMFSFIRNKYKSINNVLIISDVSRSEMIKYKKSYSEILTQNNIKFDTFDFLESDPLAEERVITDIKNKSYKFVFMLSGSSSSSKIIEIMNNHKTIFIGTENFGSSANQTLYLMLKDKNINSYFSRNIDFLKQQENLDIFKHKYQNKYNKMPTLLSAYTYDAMNILINVIRKNLPLTNENMYKIDYNGISGVQIKNGIFNRSKYFSILKIEENGYRIAE